MSEVRHTLVGVLDAKGSRLPGCNVHRARQLLRRGRATIHTYAPFAIRLVKSVPDTARAAAKSA